MLSLIKKWFKSSIGAENRRLSDKCVRLSRDLKRTKARLDEVASRSGEDKLKEQNTRLTRDLKRLQGQLREAEGLLRQQFRIALNFEADQIDTFPERVAFATALNGEFVPGLECLLYSLNKAHSNFDAVSFHVFHDGTVDVEAQRYISAVYPNVVFKKVDDSAYVGIEPHPRIGHVSYYAFEALLIENVDKVVLIDSDILCLNPIADMFSRGEQQCSAAMNVGESLVPFKYGANGNFVFNSGVMVLGGEFLGNSEYQKVLCLARGGAGKDKSSIARFADQRVFNVHLEGKVPEYLSLYYNATIRLSDTHPDFDLGTIGLLHFTGSKPWNAEVKGMNSCQRCWHEWYREAREYGRTRYMKLTGVFEQLARLKNKYEGERAFILGNGPSISQQDLTLLRDELTFVSNWFALHEDYDAINPDFYCLCSHTIFGGWGVDKPDLEAGIRKLLNEKTRNAVKVFSFEYKNYLEENDVFPGHELLYLLFEKPLKSFVDSSSEYNLDPSKPLHDGHTVLVTFCMLLANWLGVKEIYLLGCDCDYGIKNDDDSKAYFYPGEQHTTKTSAMKHLRAVWGDESSRIFKTYAIVRDTLSANGVSVYNATHGGKLEVFQRVKYEELF